MSFTCQVFLYYAWCHRAIFFHCGWTVCTTSGLSLAAAIPLWVFFQQNCFYLAASWHLSQESRASPFCCFAKILKLTSLYCEQFCPELMRFLTCLRIPRIKPLSLGRGRFSKIISNSLNHHGSRKRGTVLLSESIYRLEARAKRKIPSSLPSSINTSERSYRKWHGDRKLYHWGWGEWEPLNKRHQAWRKPKGGSFVYLCTHAGRGWRSFM